MLPLRIGATVEDYVETRASRPGDLDPSCPTPVTELIDGQLFAYERAAYLEDLWHPLIHALLAPTFGHSAPIPWQCDNGAKLLVNGSVLAPMAVAWNRSELPNTRPLLADSSRCAVYEHAPDLVLEIVCSNTAAHVRERKLPVYASVGVRLVWLLHADERIFEILEEHEGGWRTRAAYSEETVIHPHPFPCAALDLATFWDTDAERSQRVRGLVDRLGMALKGLEDEGASQRDLFHYLLKRLGRSFDQSRGRGLVGQHMMRSRWVVLRARALVSCMVPFERALRVAHDELTADGAVAALTPEEGEAMAIRYADLLTELGEDHPEVQDLAGTARAWARRALWLWSEPRVDRLAYRHAPPALVRAWRAAEPDESARSAALHDLVLGGPGAWLVPRDAWHEAVTRVTAELPAPALCTEPLEVIFAALERQEPEAFEPPKATRRRSMDDLVVVPSKGQKLEPEYEERPLEDDVVLEWRTLKQEMHDDLAVLRKTGVMPPRLDGRGASGEGLALLTPAEEELMQAAFFRSLDAQIAELDSEPSDDLESPARDEPSDDVHD